MLRRIGASARRSSSSRGSSNRSLTGHLNRVVNAESANLRRAVAAARRQLADIDALERRGALRRLPKDTRRVAAERRRAPEATFTELAATLDMSRSQVQRAFEIDRERGAPRRADEAEPDPRWT